MIVGLNIRADKQNEEQSGGSSDKLKSLSDLTRPWFSIPGILLISIILKGYVTNHLHFFLKERDKQNKKYLCFPNELVLFKTRTRRCINRGILLKKVDL